MSEKMQAVQVQEEAIFKLVQEGHNEAAKEQLLQLVINCAKRGDFSNAERLRDRIYEIDPMALREIIRAGEVIEERMNSSIDEADQDTWASLIELLTSEEFSSMYHDMEQLVFQEGDVLVRQGAQNDGLFFINSGSVCLWYTKGDRQELIKELNGGEIVGESFFAPSSWTLSITAITTCKVSVLKRAKLEARKETLPGLESKLRDFYNRFNNISSLLKENDLDRRCSLRFSLEQKVVIQVINKSGQPQGRGFRGELVDISQGGLSLLSRITKRKNTYLLLGRYLKVIISLDEVDRKVQVAGQVIAVQPYSLLDQDYSIHLKFGKLLEDSFLESITGQEL